MSLAGMSPFGIAGSSIRANTVHLYIGISRAADRAVHVEFSEKCLNGAKTNDCQQIGATKTFICRQCPTNACSYAASEPIKCERRELHQIAVSISVS
jgi:hypothetical protein